MTGKEASSLSSHPLRASKAPAVPRHATSHACTALTQPCRLSAPTHCCRLELGRLVAAGVKRKQQSPRAGEGTKQTAADEQAQDNTLLHPAKAVRPNGTTPQPPEVVHRATMALGRPLRLDSVLLDARQAPLGARRVTQLLSHAASRMPSEHWKWLTLLLQQRA